MFDVPAAITASATLATTVLEWRKQGKAEAVVAALEDEIAAINAEIEDAHTKGDSDRLELAVSRLVQLQLRVASGSPA